jgi:hypothetical protein
MSAAMERILTAIFHPIRFVVRILFAPHWFFTLLSLTGITWFVVIVFDMLPSSKHRPVWWLGVGAVLFAFAAIKSWIERFRRRAFEYSDEQLEEMRVQRLAEIQHLLIRQLTADEARNMMAELDKILHEPKRQRKAMTAFDDWLTQNAASEDELWFYDTGGDSWEHLHGEDGFAIIRNGQIVDCYMWMMN